MNPAIDKEQETKTIKYLNKSDQDLLSDSQSSTAKQYEQQLMLARKIFQSKSNNKQNKDGPNCKIVVIQTLQNYGQKNFHHGNHNGQPIRRGHKKGKSMDLQQLITHSREHKRQFNNVQSSRQKSKKYKDIHPDLRQRKSISQMKQYHTTNKKHTSKNVNETNLFVQKKKSKTANSNQIKSTRNQGRKMGEDTPMFVKTKRKDHGKQTQRVKSLQQSKQLKNYSKSEQLFPQNKNKKKTNSKQHNVQSQQFRQISFSMPMTSKIINLFSNNSSVYNSRKELQPLGQGRSYMIPTEQSCSQIEQIRQYENSFLKKMNSESIRNIRKSAPIHNFVQADDQGKRESTQNLIQEYIQKYNEFQHEKNKFSNQMIRRLKGDKLSVQKQSINDAHVYGTQINEMKDILESQSIRLDKSEFLQTPIIKKQEQDLSQLDNLIKQLQSNGNTLQSMQKQQILGKIKCIIQQTSGKKQQSPEKQTDTFNQQLTNSQLKESFNFEDNMSQLNLQLIDKALREREAYLVERKEKQLQKLQEIFEGSQQQFKEEKQKIIKWIDHQIKSVTHTRRQLWKGFNIAKQILESSEASPNAYKKGQMMKCLSDKYLNRVKKTNHKKAQINIENKNRKLRQQYQEKQSQCELKQGRISPVQKKQQQKQPQVVEEFEEQQLLSQQKQVKQDKNIYQQDNDDSSIDEEYEYDRNNILNKPIEYQETQQHSPVKISETVGLNIKQIQCDSIDYQASYDVEQIQQLGKQQQRLKQNQIKIPKNLKVDDKQDIFEFIFLDLCVELTDQYPIDSKVIKKIFSFIKSVDEQSKKQKGFKTNTTAVKQYLFEFVSYLKSNQDLLDDVYINLEKPLGPTALDILKYMHPYDEQPVEDESNQTVFILDIKLFQKFQNEYLNKKVTFQKYYQDQQKQKKRRAFLKNAIHIHNKAIFDALNQTLDKQRPYGVWGQPFSWKKTAKFYHERDRSSKNNILLKSSQKTIEYGAYMCGFMVDKQDCNLRNNPNISQAYIDQIRDDRLSRMLANDLEQGQEKMLFIDDEQTEILVEVGHLIYQNLLQELFSDLSFMI